MRTSSFYLLTPILAFCAVARGDGDWKQILQASLASERSQTRQDGLKQVDTTTTEGLKALWQALAIRDGMRVDWYVREGAHEALQRATTPEAEKEIDRVLKESDPRLELAREAILYAIQWKIRTEVIKFHGKNDDRVIEEVKYRLRKARGVDYFSLVLPPIEAFDPEKKQLKRLQTGVADKSTRVRRAALTGLALYPDNSSIPLLIENLRTLEKKKLKSKLYREWVLTRYALEVLTGQYYRDNVEDWAKWWDIAQGKFSIKKRIEEEKDKKETDGKTVVVRKEGLEVSVHMKVAGPPEGYPLIVIPWDGMEADYFRPYFHGVEEVCRVYYVRMPQIEDFKGLARDAKSNTINYPTAILAEGLSENLKESKLEKFAVLGHGPHAGVFAMTLASKHPEQVTHLVLINPRSAGAVYGSAIDNVRREGLATQNQELVKGADSILIMEDGNPKYKPGDDAEHAGLGRALANLRFADPSEPEVGTIDYFFDLPGGVSRMNDQTWKARDLFPGKPTLPVLIFMGAKSPWTPMNDMKLVAGLFPRAVVVEMRESAELPFLSETGLFTQHMQAFFKGAKLPGKEGEKASSKSKSGSSRTGVSKPAGK